MELHRGLVDPASVILLNAYCLKHMRDAQQTAGRE
jgi:hypothetical protein